MNHIVLFSAEYEDWTRKRLVADSEKAMEIVLVQIE